MVCLTSSSELAYGLYWIVPTRGPQTLSSSGSSVRIMTLEAGSGKPTRFMSQSEDLKTKPARKPRSKQAQNFSGG